MAGEEIFTPRRHRKRQAPALSTRRRRRWLWQTAADAAALPSYLPQLTATAAIIESLSAFALTKEKLSATGGMMESVSGTALVDTGA